MVSYRLPLGRHSYSYWSKFKKDAHGTPHNYDSVGTLHQTSYQRRQDMSCMPSSLYKPLTVYCIIVEPPINGQVGAGGFVRYSEVSRGFTIIWLCTPNMFKVDNNDFNYDELHV